MNVDADDYTAATNKFSDILELSKTFLFRISIFKFISFITLYHFFHLRYCRNFQYITNLVKSIELMNHFLKKNNH